MKNEKKLLFQIGDNIRKFRNTKGKSQQFLADECNIAKSTIQRIESGKLNPTILMLEKIAKSLEIELNELINSNDILIQSNT